MDRVVWPAARDAGAWAEKLAAAVATCLASPPLHTGPVGIRESSGSHRDRVAEIHQRISDRMHGTHS